MDQLTANTYNPNVVFSPELRLLELSLIRTGWVQPLLVGRSGIIIDGFHRWSLARKSKALQKRDGGLVPVARLDVEDSEAMALTIRMNRARGQPVAVQLSKVVQTLRGMGVPPEELARGLGMGAAEVKLLEDGSLLKARSLADVPFSQAWIPEEDGRRGRTRGKGGV